MNDKIKVSEELKSTFDLVTLAKKIRESNSDKSTQNEKKVRASNVGTDTSIEIEGKKEAPDDLINQAKEKFSEEHPDLDPLANNIAAWLIEKSNAAVFNESTQQEIKKLNDNLITFIYDRAEQDFENLVLKKANGYYNHILGRSDIKEKDKVYAYLSFISDFALSGLATFYFIGHFLNLFLTSHSSKILGLSIPAFYTSLCIGVIAGFGFAIANFLLNLKEASSFNDNDPRSAPYRYSNSWRGNSWKVLILTGFVLTALTDIATTDFVVLLTHPNLSPMHEALIHGASMLLGLLVCYADFRTRQKLMAYKRDDKLIKGIAKIKLEKFNKKIKKAIEKKTKKTINKSPLYEKTIQSLKYTWHEIKENPSATFNSIMEFCCVWLAIGYTFADVIDPAHTFEHEKTFSKTMQHFSIQAGVIIGFIFAIAAAYCHYVINRDNSDDDDTQHKMSPKLKKSIAFIHYLSDVVEIMAGILLCYEVAFGTGSNTTKWPVYVIGCILGAIFSVAPWNTSYNALGLGQNKSEERADDDIIISGNAITYIKTV